MFSKPEVLVWAPSQPEDPFHSPEISELSSECPKKINWSFKTVFDCGSSPCNAFYYNYYYGAELD